MGFLESFLNPWALGGLSLAAAPIIIHLLNRKRFQIHNWAAMDFLLTAAITNRRRLKLEDWILLALRILLIVILVLAFTRPVLKGFGHWYPDEQIVILDDSFSMDVLKPTGTVFESARDGAVNVVQDALARGVPTILRSGSRPDVALDTPNDTTDSSAFETRAWEVLQSIPRTLRRISNFPAQIV